VQPGDLDLEAADDREHRLGDEAGPVRVEQAVERAAHPVVVERRGVAGLEPEHGRVVGRQPLAERVDRPVAHHDVAHDHPDHRRRGEAQPGVIVRQVALQAAGQAHAPEEPVDDGQAPDGLAAQREALRCPHRLPP